jgi:hypothetical protein
VDDVCGCGSEIELVCSAKQLLDEDTVGDSLSNNSCVYVCQKPRYESESGGHSSGQVVKFYHMSSGKSYELPFDPEGTVLSAKVELSRKLLRPVSEISIINVQTSVCLEDSAALTGQQTGGRPFEIVVQDFSEDPTESQVQFLKKQAPKLEVSVASALFFRCGARPLIFIRTCKARGLV